VGEPSFFEKKVKCQLNMIYRQPAFEPYDLSFRDAAHAIVQEPADALVHGILRNI
jgi:hypothetical protein